MGSKKLLLLNDTSNWYHFGCTGTSNGLKSKLSKYGSILETVCIADLYRLAFPPKEVRLGDPVFYADFRQFNEDLGYGQIFKMIDECDCAVFNGEGSIHGGSQYALILLYLAHAIKTVDNKSVQIINHSVFPSKQNTPQSKVFPILAQEVYKAIDFAACRDPFSQEWLNRIEGSYAQRSFDCLIYTVEEFRKANLKIKKDGTILVTDSVLLRNPDNMSRFIRLVGVLADKGYKVKYIYGAPDKPAVEMMEAAKKLENLQESNFNIKIKPVSSLEEWLTEIMNSKIVISGRYHYGMASVLLNIPTLFFSSNTPKIEGFIEELSHQRSCLSILDQNFEVRMISDLEEIEESGKCNFLSDDRRMKMIELANNNFSKL